MQKKPIKIAIVNYDKVLISSLIGMVDIFAIVNNFCLDNTTTHYFHTEILHTDEKIKNFNFLINFTSKQLDDKDSYDLIIIPPIIDTNFNFQANTHLIQWINTMYNKNSTIASVCVGAYVLAQSGLLNNKCATTHWVIESKMKQDFPMVKLDTNKLIIEDGNIITAGGASAYIYLCLYIVRKLISNEASYMCANYLGVDAGKKSQQHYKDLAQIAINNDQDIEKLVLWIETNFSKNITLQEMSKKVSVSERTLIRKFKKATGDLPHHYIQKLRVQKAKELLINTANSFERITYLVGYTNPSTFRKLFKKATNFNPIEYRKIFMAK
jgi:transcriptional regulator GlxA family with amidase domain